MNKIFEARIEEEGDDFVLSFEDEMIKELGWEIGDTLTFFTNERGEVCIEKRYRDEPVQRDMFDNE